MDEQALPPFFFEIFDRSLPRQGPGNEACTVKALRLLGLLDDDGRPTRHSPETEPLRLLDVGCGTGAQTIDLAKHLGAQITALDFHADFLDELVLQARMAGLASHIETRLGDMRDIPTWPERFDVVWAEGSFFIMGFGEALKACHHVLKPGGVLAASDLVWLRPDPPAECRDFFAQEVPGLTDVAGMIAAVEPAGYKVISQFTLPDEAWWEFYYRPLEARVAMLRALHPDESDKTELLDGIQAEIDLFRRFSAYYGYVFCLMRRD